MICIFCDKESNAKSVEHIISESFGNSFYTLPKGAVCDDCNNKFSKFEAKALTNTVFVVERARLSIKTKKGKSAKGKVNELVIQADEKFRKGHMNIKGLTKNDVKNIDQEKKTFELIVSAFDKSEVATSKFLLSTALEAIYQSDKPIFKKYNFSELKEFVIGQNNSDWPFITSDLEIKKFTSIPKMYDKHRLNKIHCSLKILEVDGKTLLFKFKFGGISMIINLLNRNIDWIAHDYSIDKKASIYPEHYRKKVAKLLSKR